jgi:hypothetical protein
LIDLAGLQLQSTQLQRPMIPEDRAPQAAWMELNGV